ncbi:unnamed protein product, partial [Oppiella nova]
YLEHRFDRRVRMVASLVFTSQMIIYMSIVLYAPALALNAVTGLSKWTAILSVGIVCTIYCTIGGIKAVIWTDVFQSFLMFTAMIIIVVKGVYDVGGVDVLKSKSDDKTYVLVANNRRNLHICLALWCQPNTSSETINS